jgi:crossover junction endodeoxyribonuclease RuvC
VTVYIGIDPGLSGAIARLDGVTSELRVEDVPTFELVRNGKKKREIDVHSLARILDDMAKEPGTRIIIEGVGAMPGQGVSSVFAFGKAFGILIGVSASTFCPIDFVSPAKWKRYMGVTASKDGSRAKASMMFPRYSELWRLAKNADRAEALLIAAWAAETERGF